jgi:hypothetical protein
MRRSQSSTIRMTQSRIPQRAPERKAGFMSTPGWIGGHAPPRCRYSTEVPFDSHRHPLDLCYVYGRDVGRGSPVKIRNPSSSFDFAMCSLDLTTVVTSDFASDYASELPGPVDSLIVDALTVDCSTSNPIEVVTSERMCYKFWERGHGAKGCRLFRRTWEEREHYRREHRVAPSHQYRSHFLSILRVNRKQPGRDIEHLLRRIDGKLV